MMSEHRPYVPDDTPLADWSWRGLALGILFGSGLIAGEALMGIGIAVTALIIGRKPPGLPFGLTGTTGAMVSLAAFGLLGWLLVRSTRRTAG